jgi:hypothetical protein
MKKDQPPHFVTLLLMMFSISSVAQPTLTGSSSNPVIGDQLTYNKSNYVSPGNAGANQTWNLSAMTSTASASEFVAPASTPSPSIPNSNISLQVGTSTYYYYKTNSIALQNCSDILYGNIISYSNPEDALQYPFTFNNTFVDTYQGGGFGISRNGTSTVTADGYGTLITPAGTYTNVLRIKIVRNYVDDPGSVNLAITSDVLEYLWFSPNQRFHLASIYTMTNTSQGGTTTAQGGHYIGNYLTGIEEQNSWSNTVDLYPIPASNVLHIGLTGQIPTTIKASLYSTAGQLLKESTIITQGKVDLEYQVADIPNGIYLINLKSDRGFTTQKRIVISK